MGTRKRQKRHSETSLGLSDDLINAVRNESLKDVEYILEIGCNVNAKRSNHPNSSALHCAVQRNLVEITRLLLRQSDCQVDSVDSNNQTPLHYVAKEGHVNPLRLLVDHGANVNALDCHKRTPLMVIADLVTVEASHVACFMLLLEESCNAGGNFQQEDRHGRTIVHLAAARGHVVLLERLFALKLQPVVDCLFKEDDEGNLPTVLATLNGHKDCIVRLMGEKADTAIASRQDHTLLHKAASAGQVSCAEFFLTLGAAINSQDPVTGRTPLHEAAKAGHLDVINLLIERGASLSFKDSRGRRALWNDQEAKTPLHLAAEKGHSDILQVLSEKAAEEYGMTEPELLAQLDNLCKAPIHLAVQHGHLNCIQVMKAHVNMLDGNRCPPIIYAVTKTARKLKLPCLQLLLELGADIELRDASNKTALDYAKQSDDAALVVVLLEAKNDKLEQALLMSQSSDQRNGGPVPVNTPPELQRIFQDLVSVWTSTMSTRDQQEREEDLEKIKQENVDLKEQLKILQMKLEQTKRSVKRSFEELMGAVSSGTDATQTDASTV